MNAQPARLSAFLLRRLWQAVPLVFGVLVITFTLIHVAPGDPITFLAGDGGSASYYREMRAHYGLDRSIPEQLVRYILSVLSGDFGYSFNYQQPVINIILSRLPATLLLMGTALVLSTVFGLLLGLVAATHPNRLLDHLI